jgi:hypothetical protein
MVFMYQHYIQYPIIEREELVEEEEEEEALLV